MKQLFILIFFVFPHIISAQTNKHTIYYEAEVLYQIIKNISTEGTKELGKKAFGVDVTIAVDTIFKKYTFLYTNERNERTIGIFYYIRDAFPDESKSSKIYIMQLFDSTQILLKDMTQFFPFISYSFSIENNNVLEYYVADAKRTTPTEIKKRGNWIWSEK